MKARQAYNALLRDGELLEMYPELSGSWEKDKESFSIIWEQNKEAIKDIDVYFDEFE